MHFEQAPCRMHSLGGVVMTCFEPPSPHLDLDLLRQLGASVFELDEAFRIRSLDTHALLRLGRSSSREVHGQPWIETCLAADAHAGVESTLRRFMASDPSSILASFEAPALGPSGGTKPFVWLAVRLTPALRSSAQPAAKLLLLGLPHRRSEFPVHAKLEPSRETGDPPRAGDAAVCELDADGRIRSASRKFAEICGCEPAELASLRLADLALPAHRERVETLSKLPHADIGQATEFVLERPGGDPLWVSACACPRPSTRDTLLVRFLDLSRHQAAQRAAERKTAQHAALAQIAEQILRRGELNAHAREIVRVIAKALEVPRCAILRYEPANDALRLVAGTGLPHTEDPDKPLLANPHGPEFSCWRSREPVAVADFDTDSRFAHPILACDPPIVRCVCVAIRNGDRPWGVLAVYPDRGSPVLSDDAHTFLRSVAALLGLAAERTETERRRVERDREFSELLDHAADGIMRLALDGTITEFNAAAASLTGLPISSALGGNVLELPLFRGEARELVRTAFRQALSGAVPEPVTATMEDDGEHKGERLVEARLRLVRRHDNPHAIICTLRDLTELHRLQRQFYAAQRMEGIGRLAGGIAHDFNNVLAVIISLGSFLREMSTEADLSKDLELILDAAQRGADLVQQLLAFSRRKATRPQQVRVDQTVKQLEPMLARILGEHVKMSLHAEAHSWPVMIEPTQLEQVIVNLVVNARDAMPRGGKLTIETCNVELDAAYVRSHPVARTGSYVLLVVSDTGCGIRPDVLERIFEPFFTTKKRGVGTGLGLATCYGIVKQAGGFIWAYSEVGKGSSFKVYLPRAEEAGADHAPDRTAQTPVLPADHGKGKTILIVEDDEFVRTVTARLLQHWGYRVLQAESGERGLEIARNAPRGRLDAVLTDVVLPGMDGREFAERLQQRFPEVRVLYMSGYTENAIVHHGVLDQDITLVNKPFTPATLARALHELFRSPESGADA